RLRFPERQVAGIRWLVANIDHSSSTFLCPEGLYSLFLWADKEPASHIFLAHEVNLFTRAQQQAMLDSLVATPPPLIVDHAKLLPSGGLEGDAPLRPSTLRDGIEREFVPYGGGTVEGYALKVKRGQPLPDVVECAHWVGDRSIPSATLDLLPKPGRVASR